MLDYLHLEIMDMNCQDALDAEYKREKLKIKLNSIDENDRNVIDYGHLKNMQCYNVRWEGKCDIMSILKIIETRID